MPRAARKQSQSGIYHVVLRGINRQQIFEDDEDCEKLLQVLVDCKELSGFQCYAYCLMGNHIHILLRTGQESLGQIFRRIGARYVYWYNWKYGRSGHLFQDRYKSKAVENDCYLISVVRYIHQNPVKAGLKKEPELYRWSSAGAYCTGSDSLTDTEFVLSLFSKDPKEQVEKYVEYMQGHDDAEYLNGEDDKRLTDADARNIMNQICGVSSTAEFQAIEVNQREAVVKKMHEQGVSIRHLSRLTGISIGLIRKIL